MVEVLVRNRFFPLPDAKAEKVGPNAWQVTVPKTDAVARVSRRKMTLEDWDGAVFVIDDAETEPGVASRETKSAVVITALVF